MTFLPAHGCCAVSSCFFGRSNDGSYWCGKCPRRGFPERQGSDETHHPPPHGLGRRRGHLRSVRGIERVTCSTPSCGRLRRSGVRVCNPCGQATPARPPAVGDIIMAPLGAPTGATGVAGVEHGTAAPIPSARVEPPQLPPPTHFTQTIRLLPANTLLHILSSCRLRMIAATAQCWQGMARDSDDFAPLEKGRSKLLLASLPPGLGIATEVAKRLTLSEGSRFEDLLRRAEEQLLVLRKAGKRKKRGAKPDPPAGADRARQTAAVGAYRKATTRLVSSMLSFEEEDLTWARERLPTSTLGAQAYSDPAPEPHPLTPDLGLGSALRRTALRRPHSSRPHRHSSGTCSACLDGFMPTSSTRRSRRVLPDLCRHASSCRAMAHTHAALLAAQEEWQAETHQDG